MPATTMQERQEFRGALRGAIARLQSRTGTGPGPEETRTIWNALARDVGLAGIAVPEGLGGAGLGLAELMAACEETGRSLLSTPLVSSAGIAGDLLASYRDDKLAREQLRRASLGESIMAVVAQDGLITDAVALPLRGVRDGQGWRVTGGVDVVVGAAAADVLLVVTDTDAGPTCLAVEAGGDGVRVIPRHGLDPTRDAASVRLTRASAASIGAPGSARGPLVSAFRVGSLLLAAEMIGAAARVLELTVDHVTERIQFGKRIGTFQAVQHKCAEMYAEVEYARSALWAATDGQSEIEDPARGVLASIAQIACSRAFARVASESIQLHGGIGFTWEHPAHRFLKKAMSDRAVLGSSDEHLDFISRTLKM